MTIGVPAGSPTLDEDFVAAHTYEGIALTQRLTAVGSVVEHLRERRRRDAGRPFLTAVGLDGDATTLSYGELDVLTARLAHWVPTIGCRAGDVVGLLPANDLDSVLAIVGLLRARCPLLLLDPADPPSRRREQTAALGVDVVLRSPFVEPEPDDAQPVPDLRRVEDPPCADEPAQFEPSADALFFGTSGSTATSKLVAQSHYCTAVNAEAVRRHHGLVPGDRLLGCLPLHHVNGVHFTLFATLAAGAHAVLARGFDPFAYPRLVRRFRPRLASVVPSILEALLTTWRDEAASGELEYFVSAAAPLAASTARSVRRELGVRVVQGYGLTETTNFSTTMPRSLPPELHAALASERDIPSVGTAVYGNEVAVMLPDGTRAAPGEVGELCMRGHNVMTRYHANPEATRQAFSGGWFHSGDLGFAELHEGREFFVITGRNKNIAKVRGESVSLDELERVLRAVPSVADAACAVRPDSLLGDEIVAAVVLGHGGSQSMIRAALDAALPSAAHPREIVTVDAIPRTPTGKLRRPELLEDLTGLLAERHGA